MTTNNRPALISIIEGKTPILLIAPHGVYDDDDNTGIITEKLAKKLKCYAVINELYRKPRTAQNQSTDKSNQLLDLNKIPQVQKYLKEEFLTPIIQFKDKIVADHGKALIVLIHGVMDDNANETDMFIGIGLPDRLSAPIGKAEKLKTILSELPKPIKAKIVKGGNYAGWDKRNLNQLFAEINPDYYDEKVQSIQLEIRKRGFRETPKNIKHTVKRLTVALVELMDIKINLFGKIWETVKKWMLSICLKIRALI